MSNNNMPLVRSAMCHWQLTQLLDEGNSHNLQCLTWHCRCNWNLDFCLRKQQGCQTESVWQCC
ncbi:MAG: hypothetical protein ACKPKO_17505, partial [Candidatus Fonsibacter sp.]